MREYQGIPLTERPSTLELSPNLGDGKGQAAAC
jgi:hypothetical protein